MIAILNNVIRHLEIMITLQCFKFWFGNLFNCCIVKKSVTHKNYAISVQLLNTNLIISGENTTMYRIEWYVVVKWFGVRCSLLQALLTRSCYNVPDTDLEKCIHLSNLKAKSFCSLALCTNNTPIGKHAAVCNCNYISHNNINRWSKAKKKTCLPVSRDEIF